MPTIAIVEGVAILMYPNDHNPPHIHARLAEHHCKISIVTGEVISGTLPTAKVKAVQAWLISRQSEVTFAWNELHNARSIDGMIK